jgi:hypothetical protein
MHSADKRSHTPAASHAALAATGEAAAPPRMDDVRGVSRCKTQGSNAGSKRETRSQLLWRVLEVGDKV